MFRRVDLLGSLPLDVPALLLVSNPLGPRGVRVHATETLLQPAAALKRVTANGTSTPPLPPLVFLFTFSNPLFLTPVRFVRYCT